MNFQPEGSHQLGEAVASLLPEWKPVQTKHRQDGLDIGVTMLRAMEAYARRVQRAEKAEDVLIRVLGAAGWAWEETYPQIAV